MEKENPLRYTRSNSEVVHHLWELVDSEETIISLLECLFVHRSDEERLVDHFLISSIIELTIFVALIVQVREKLDQCSQDRNLDREIVTCLL